MGSMSTALAYETDHFCLIPASGHSPLTLRTVPVSIQDGRSTRKNRTVVPGLLCGFCLLGS